MRCSLHSTIRMLPSGCSLLSLVVLLAAIQTEESEVEGVRGKCLERRVCQVGVIGFGINFFLRVVERLKVTCCVWTGSIGSNGSSITSYNPSKIAARSVGCAGSVPSGSAVSGMCWSEGAA